jgi:hypothetical protein
MMDTVGAKRRWVVDIFTKVYIIVNHNVDSIIISSIFRGVQGGRNMVKFWPCKPHSVFGNDPRLHRPSEVVILDTPRSAIGSETIFSPLPF